MTILKANLKHLYQRRGMWFWCLYLLLLGPVFIKIGLEGDRYLGYLFISFFTGLIVASIQKEIISKPFSFCLPGHSEIPRRLFLWVGAVVNGLLGFVFMFHPTVEFPFVLLVVLAGGVVGMIVYLLCAASNLFLRLETGKFTWPLMMIVIYGVVFKKLDVALQDVIVTSPLIVIGLGALICWFVWRRIDIESLRRQNCGKMAITLFDGYNKAKVAKYTLARLAEKDKKKPNSVRTSFAVEDFFLSRISQAQIGSLPQYIWGSLYKSFGILISQRRQNCMGILIAILPVLCFLCYMPGRMKNIIFVMPGMLILHMSLWVYSSLSVSGGRRERFWSALTLATVTGVLVTVVIMLLAMGTHVVESMMPQLTIKGHEFTFSALDMNFSLVPLLMIPVTLTIGLICHKNPMLKIILVMVLFQVLFISSIVSKLTIFRWLVQIDPEHIIIMLLCSWAVFVAVLRYISMRCCLVSQSR